MWKTILTHRIAAILVFTFLFYSPTLNSQVTVAYEPAITGLNLPMQAVTAPGDMGGRLFIVEKAGVIRIWTGTSIRSTPFLDISSIVVDNDERGLLSMAFHPQYQTNGFFFVYYNSNAGNITISRYQVSAADSNVANPTANPVTPLVSIPKPFENHNGGQIHFRVEGGTNYLYFATGDGGSGNDPLNNAQNPASLLGKMIRIDVDAPTPAPEIWAWGLRNPFRWSFDRLTGDIWIGDVGQGAREEVNFRAAATSGTNYGWPCLEGTRDNSASAPAGLDCDTVESVAVAPIFEYVNPPCCGTSVVGGVRYRGTAYPAFEGYYMAADFYDGNVWFIRSDGSGGWTVSGPQSGLPANISSFSETNDGDTIYAVSLTANTIYKVIPSVVLPVTLTSFSGTSATGYNDLKWTTAYESDIEKYIIEFSTDGRNYMEAGTVLSVNDPGSHTYTFRHNIAGTSRVLYRLRVAEMNGSFNYSPIIVLGSREKPGVTVYPTVISSGLVNLVASSPVERIELISVQGQKVLSKNTGNATGYFQVSLPSIPKGIYYMQILEKDLQHTEKIIIQ